MRQFYLEYPKFQTLTGKSTRTHFCELLSISDMVSHSFYEKECERSGWSVRKMKRLISNLCVNAPKKIYQDLFFEKDFRPQS